MRKKHRYVDKRLDWRDPNMPVIRTGTVNGVFGVHEIEPKWITPYHARNIESSIEPDWRHDSTYYLRKGKSK